MGSRSNRDGLFEKNEELLKEAIHCKAKANDESLPEKEREMYQIRADVFSQKQLDLVASNLMLML